MKIEKAIEILSITLEVKSRLGKNDEHDAILLGIEALKLYVDLPLHILPKVLRELLDETTEEER